MTMMQFKEQINAVKFPAKGIAEHEGVGGGWLAAVSRIYPKADIRCVMVSTVLKQVVR